jgi:hypothetical protein
MFFTEFTTTQWRDLLNRPRAVKTNDVLDGTSHTAMFAEIKRGLVAGSQSTYNPGLQAQDVRQVPNAQGIPPIAACMQQPSAVTGNVFRYPGLQYHRSFAFTSFYTHGKSPNDPTVDCCDLTSGHVTARSYHPGIANVGFTDGAVKSINSTIAVGIWRNLGSRADGTPVQAP